MLKRKSTSQRIAFSIVFVIFILISISLIYPFVWLFINSFKMDVDFRANSFNFPSRWIFANYYDALTYVHKGNTIFTMLLNSLIVVAGRCILGIFVPCCTSYILAKYKFKLNKFLFNLALIIMIIPGVGSTVSIFELWHKIGIYDKFISVFIMAAGGFGSSFLLLYATFKNLSWTYAEAGFLDGASHFKVFWKLMLPQILPVVVSLLIINVIAEWNDFFTPYMYLPSKLTVAVGIYEIQVNALTKQQYPLMFAMMLLSVLPVMVLFIFMQNTIMENVTAGGIKG